jgi:hypothetical protein
MTVDKLDALERAISDKVFAELRVMITGISVYSMNTMGGSADAVHDDIRRIVMSHDHVLQMHGFYMDEEKKLLRFDIIIDFAAPDRYALYQHLCEDVQKIAGDYRVEIAMDSDISD